MRRPVYMRQLASMFLIPAGLALAGCGAVQDEQAQSGWGIQFGAPTSRIADADANTAISSLLHDEFGQALESSDHSVVAEAQEKALDTKGVGVTVGWHNAKTGHQGEVRPGPVYQVNATTCREFTHEMVLQGRHYKSRGTACMDDKGSWKTLS